MSRADVAARSKYEVLGVHVCHLFNIQINTSAMESCIVSFRSPEVALDFQNIPASRPCEGRSYDFRRQHDAHRKASKALGLFEFKTRAIGLQ